MNISLGRDEDGRRALGVRPGTKPPMPRVLIGDGDQDFESVPPSPVLPRVASPKSRHLSLGVSPDLRLNTSASYARSPTSPSSVSSPWRPRKATLARSQQVNSTTGGLSGNQKLLSHLLDQLERRDAPPDLLDKASLHVREFHGASKGKGKGKAEYYPSTPISATQQDLLKEDVGPSRSRAMGGGASSEVFEVVGEGDWINDRTVDLANQVLEIFRLADSAQQDLFGASASGSDASRSMPAKTKVKHGRFPSLALPSTPSKPRTPQINTLEPTYLRSSGLSGLSLLSRLIDILHSIVAEDCLHRTLAFSPSSPPQGLQAAAVNIAAYLYEKGGIESQLEVVEIIITAFYSMEAGMIDRICGWLEGRLGELLGRLAKERGGEQDYSGADLPDPIAPQDRASGLPTFAISPDPKEEAKSSSAYGWMQFSPLDGADRSSDRAIDTIGILSSYDATDRPSTLAIDLSSLARSALLAITSTFDITNSSLTTIYRVHRLIALILSAKADASVDLLEIIAHGPPKAQRNAAELLSTFSPNMSGHNSIARRLATCTYTAHRARWETGQNQALGEDRTDGHNFLPWRIRSKDRLSEMQSACSICENEIRGFALRCTLCNDVQHLQCYRQTENHFTYDVTHLSETKPAHQAVTIRFSRLPLRPDEQLSSSVTVPGEKANATHVRAGQHNTVLVHLFDLCLCAVCRQPLWGSHAQAYACTGGCQQLFHPLCLAAIGQGHLSQCLPSKSLIIDDLSRPALDPFTIRLEDVQTSFKRAAGDITSGATALGKHTYDEIAILYGQLWTLYQIYKNGLSSGSIRILTESAPVISPDVLGMKAALKAYEDYLDQNSDRASSAVKDFVDASGGGNPLGPGYLFSTRYLTYCGALLRSPSAPDRSPQKDVMDRLLPNPSPDLSASAWTDFETSDKASSYETLRLPALYKGMRNDLNIHDSPTAALFTRHLLACGFISFASRNHITQSDLSDRTLSCSFGLPLLIDTSPTVESLILAIEELLGSLDLALNEQAMLWLVNRAWPSYLCSPFAIERLAARVVNWVMSQESSLHEVVKQFASRHQRLPGVRMRGGKGSTAVAMYQQDRARLLSRYIRPWLSAVHDLDPASFASIVYERCKDSIKLTGLVSDTTAANTAGHLAAVAMERMTTFLDSDCVFTSTLDLLTAWLEDLGSLADQDIIYRSLPKLMRHGRVKSSNTDTAGDAAGGFWHFAQETMSDGVEGHQRVCRWVRVLASSGVPIPWDTLSGLVDAQKLLSISLKAKLDLVIALSNSSRHTDVSHGRFADICGELFMSVTKDMLGQTLRQPTVDEHDLLRQALILILRAYGVSDGDINQSALGTGITTPLAPVDGLTKKRRLTTDPLGALALNEDVAVSAAAILRLGIFPSIQLLDFLWLLFSKVSLVADVDGFIHVFSRSVSPILWDLLGKCEHHPNLLRVFLRVVTINSDPIIRLARDELASERRGAARERLFGLTLAFADVSLTAEVLGWRQAAVDLTMLFFEMFCDPTDGSPETITIFRGLMPAHLQSISACFEEYLSRASPEARMALLGRLGDLRAVRRDWQILPWKSIDALLDEIKIDITAILPAETEQNRLALSDFRLIRALLLSLGLDSMAHGLPVSWDTAQRFQQHVAAACAPPWPKSHDTIAAILLPRLRQVIDSPEHLSNISGADNKTKHRALIGSLFVPIAIDFARELGKRDILVDKVILDILMIVSVKQDLSRVELPALTAVQLLARFAGDAVSSELVLLALQILNTTVQGMARVSFNRAAPQVFSTISQLLTRTIDKDGDPVIVEQAVTLLRSIGTIFGRAGLFADILALPDEAQAGQGSNLGRTLQVLHDRLPASAGNPVNESLFDSLSSSLPAILKNRPAMQQSLNRLEELCVIYQREVSDYAAEQIGSFLGRLTKAIAETSVAEFDPAPALLAAAAILPHVSRETVPALSSQMATLLNLALSRIDVRFDTVKALLGATRETTQSGGGQGPDLVRTTCLETASAVVLGSGATLTTLHALISFLIDGIAPNGKLERSHSDSALEILSLVHTSASGCIAILLGQNRVIPSPRSTAPTDVVMLRTLAAQLLSLAEAARPGIISCNFGMVEHEAGAVRLGPFIHLALAAFEGKQQSALKAIIGLFPMSSRATALCLRGSADLLAVEDVAGQGAELLSLVYVMVRLAYMLPLLDDIEPDVQEAVNLFWDRTWPDWRRLLSISFEASSVNGPLRSIAHSAFLDLVIFLQASGSTLLVQQARAIGQALEWLTDYFEKSNTNAANLARLQKATSALEDRMHVASKPDVKTLVRSIVADLQATEKLRALRTVQDAI